MPKISNHIERFLKELLNEAQDGIIEIGRNELAQQFNCAPSQINYVLTTRFTPYKGYYIESRRGGGGYIRIVKVSFSDNKSIGKSILESIGYSITKDKAYHIIEGLLEEDIISNREAKIMEASLEDTALTKANENRNHIRADILKNMLLILLK